MELEGVRALLFDLDDTLYPEREYTRSGARAVAEYLGDSAALPELLALEDESPAAPLYSRWLARRGWDEQRWLPELLAVHRNHAPDIVLEPEVRSLLVRLRGSFLLGLVSDGRLQQQEAKARALGLGPLLDAFVFSDEIGRDCWKPHPAPYRRALELLKVKAAEAVYVGDNPGKDFLGAKRAGMRSIRLRRPGGLHAAAEPSCNEAAPLDEIADLSHLEVLLHSSLKRASH
jgi:putative hydrolase of the HAD superfamily